MAFNTLDFMLLLAITLILYFVLPHRLRNPLLLIASYVFYAAYSLPLTLFLIVMTLITYFLALEIQRRHNDNEEKTTKYLMAVGVVICLGVLAFFKYFNFASGMAGRVLGIEKPVRLNLIAPLGISFVVFTLVSYIVDVYRGTVPAEKNLLKYALFISFFPKVVQGPIEKAGDIIPQFDQRHSFDLMRFREGMLMILYGLFMKMVVADTACIAVDTIYGDILSYSGASLLLATLLFTFQIYCDFAGYSYIAIGAARVMGFDFRQNFRQPYLSLSVAEFWRRWHMSLNRWLIDYLYIPLGGSRCSRLRKDYNTLVTFGLSGLWHGAGFGYIMWGLVNGLYVIIESRCHDLVLKIRTNRSPSIMKQHPVAIFTALKRFFRGAVTFALIVFSWVFFRAQSMSTSLEVLHRIFREFNFNAFCSYISGQLVNEEGATLFGLDVSVSIPAFLICLLVVIVVDLIANKHNLVHAIASGHRAVRWTICFLLIFSVLILGVYGFGYNAGAFIYAGF